jgi:hypothetical protein
LQPVPTARIQAQPRHGNRAKVLARGSPTFDAAARTWPREHGRMLGHRVNSEGLRRRAIAPSGGAPKRPYIGFGPGYCQPFRRGRGAKNQSFCAVSRASGTIPLVTFAHLAFHDATCIATCAGTRSATCPTTWAATGAAIWRLGRTMRRTAATFLRRSLVNRVLCRGPRGTMGVSDSIT